MVSRALRAIQFGMALGLESPAECFAAYLRAMPGLTNPEAWEEALPTILEEIVDFYHGTKGAPDDGIENLTTDTIVDYIYEQVDALRQNFHRHVKERTRKLETALAKYADKSNWGDIEARHKEPDLFDTDAPECVWLGEGKGWLVAEEALKDA